MKKPRDRAVVSEDDARLFREAIRDVVPLGAPPRAVHAKPRRKPVAAQRLRDEQAALADTLSDHISHEHALETGEEASFLRNGMSQQTLRRLRRGHWVVQEQLDLHGMTSLEARVMLVEFLNRCLKRGARCVRIIHGKGLRSKNREPVLKAKVVNWLMQRDEVLAFCQAPQADGGGGVTLVLLKALAR